MAVQAPLPVALESTEHLASLLAGVAEQVKVGDVLGQVLMALHLLPMEPGGVDSRTEQNPAPALLRAEHSPESPGVMLPTLQD